MAAVNVSSLPLDYLNADQGPKVDAISITCFALAVAAVFFRFLARLLTKAQLWWDDWTVLAALIFATGSLSLTIFLVEHGFGKHAEVAGTPAVLIFYKCLYIFEVVYPFPIAFTKFSILLYYKRLFRVQSIKIPIYIVGGLIVSWLIYVEAAAIFTCTPIRKAWDPTVVGGTCIDIPKFFIGIAVPNIVTDLVLLTMPLPYIWGLHVKLPQKIAVMFVFVLGGFIFIVSIIRLTALLQLGMDDVTWVYVPTCIWTNIEVHLGIVTASIPAFWPLLRALATGSVRTVTQNRTGPSRMGGEPMTGTPPGPNSIPTFLGRSRRGAGSGLGLRSAMQDDEEGFVRMKDITGGGASSTVGDVESSGGEESEGAKGGRGARKGPLVVEKPARGAAGRDTALPRIQVQSDWTVSTESNVGRERQQERSFLK